MPRSQSLIDVEKSSRSSNFRGYVSLVAPKPLISNLHLFKTYPLDAWLRDQNHCVEDEGFTARIIRSLPRRHRVWLRPALLLGATAIGFALAILWLPWKNLPVLDLQVFPLDSQVLLSWLLVFLIIGSLIWSATAALQWED